MRRKMCYSLRFASYFSKWQTLLFLQFCRTICTSALTFLMTLTFTHR